MLNLLDLAIILIFCFCAIRGIFTGLIREMFSLIGVLAGFLAASTCHVEVAKSLSPWMPDVFRVNILSFLSLFFGFSIAISVLGGIVKSLLKINLLGYVDRTFGSSVVIIKGVLIVSVLLLALTAFLPKDASVIKNSLLFSHFSSISEKMARIVSKDMRHAFLNKIELYKTSGKHEA